LSPEPLSLSRAPSDIRLVDAPAGYALEAIFQRRLARAHAAGVAEGRRLALLEGAALLDRAARELDALRERAPDELAPAAVRLASEIAGALLQRELPAGNYDVEGIVRSVLAESKVGRRSCVVHLNPADAERLRDVSFRAGTVIEPDVEVQAGDVHVTTPDGLLVREMERALADITARILGDLR
jgi:flagellar biosynthesis/type III secretory pathway protein FliH